MGNFVIENSVLKIYIGKDVNVIIPDGVTCIGVRAFSGCESLEKVTIPDSVTEIGYHAFRDCTSLTEIIIPDSVTEIGYHAFDNCPMLQNPINN